MFTVKIHFLDSKGFCPHPSHSDFSHVPEDKWSPTPQADGIYKLPKSSPHQLPRVKTWNTVWNTTWKCSGSCPEHSITSFQQRAAPPPRGKVTRFSLAPWQSSKSRTLCRQKLRYAKWRRSKKHHRYKDSKVFQSQTFILLWRRRMIITKRCCDRRYSSPISHSKVTNTLLCPSVIPWSHHDFKTQHTNSQPEDQVPR